LRSASSERLGFPFDKTRYHRTTRIRFWAEGGVTLGGSFTGLAVAGPTTITGTNTLEFGAGVADKQGEAGKIGYQTFTSDALDIVGAGPYTGSNDSATWKRKIKFWAEGGATLAGNLTVSGTISDKGALPVGAILMWSGDPANLPAGWALCDGRPGTPNLLSRFIVGYNPAQPDYNRINNTGGESTHVLSLEEMPAHDHGSAGQHAHAFTISQHGWALI
jgi:hypothetical protein